MPRTKTTQNSTVCAKCTKDIKGARYRWKGVYYDEKCMDSIWDIEDRKERAKK